MQQLIEEYIPFTRGLSTRLERELDRLHLGVDIELSTISKKDEAKKPLVRENTLIALSKKTTVSDLLKRMRSKVSSRMRSAGQSRDSMNARLLDNQGSSDETGGDSGYDSDKSISVEGEHSSSESFDEDDIDAIKRQNQLAAVIKASKEDAYKKKSAEPATKSGSGKKKSVTIDSKAAKKKKKGSDEDAKEDVKKGSESDDLKKPHKSYTVLRLRNLTREDIESTDMSRSSFVVHQELQDIGKIDRNAAQLRLRKAFAEFYRGLCLLQNYVTVNLEGIEKILSKHDKNIELGKKDQYISDVLSKCAFYRRVALTTLMRETEHVFAMAFTSGHRTAAMKKLRVANKEKASQVSTFRFGLFFGVSLTLLAIIAYMSTLLDAATVTRIRPILIMYRMTALCVFMLWGWGVDMWMWSKFRVNYIFIFEFDPRRHHRYAGIFEVSELISALVTHTTHTRRCSDRSYCTGSIGVQRVPHLERDLLPVLAAALHTPSLSVDQADTSRRASLGGFRRHVALLHRLLDQEQVLAHKIHIADHRLALHAGQFPALLLGRSAHLHHDCAARFGVLYLLSGQRRVE